MIAAGRDSAAPLRLAVPKGSLFERSVELLRAAGIDTGSLADPGRQLTVRAGAFEFVIAKPGDVPVYVAYGAVDAGIAGKDVLMEAALDVVEMLDLGFGACRFVVAESARAERSVAEHYRHLGVIRVATKYPRVTEEHFASSGVQVEIVKLGGNIEIAPLIGLADRIVDITATGRTLADNGLRVVEEVAPSSARFVANPASLRTRSDAIVGLARRLEGALPLE